MKREGQGEGGVHSELERRNAEQGCGYESTGQHVTHSMKDLCVCVCSGEKENSNFRCIPDIMSCMFCVCVLLCNGVNECLMVYKSL